MKRMKKKAQAQHARCYRLRHRRRRLSSVPDVQSLLLLTLHCWIKEQSNYRLGAREPKRRKNGRTKYDQMTKYKDYLEMSYRILHTFG